MRASDRQSGRSEVHGALAGREISELRHGGDPRRPASEGAGRRWERNRRTYAGRGEHKTGRRARKKGASRRLLHHRDRH